jgi:PAS domain S-box-containing protein
MFGMMQDITELRQAELALRVSEARFRTIVEHAADALMLLDDRMALVDVNRQACESLGYSREELLGMHPGDFDVNLDAGAIQQLADRVRAGETVTFETRHRRKDGSDFPVEIRCAPFEQGGRHFLGLARDITARKQAERALVESHALLRAVVEGTSDPIFIKDLEGRYLMINSSGAASLGRTAAEMIGKHDRELFSPETAALMMDRDREVMACTATTTAK